MFVAGLRTRSRERPPSPVRFTGSAQASSPPVKTIQPDLFSPIPANAALKRFAVLGDAGTAKWSQWEVARQMWRTYQDKPFAAALVLGDNVYEDGEPHLFDAAIGKPYGKLMKAGVRFFPVLGNHDVRQGFGPQQSAYWGAPPFYSQVLGNVEIFALDTTVFLPGYDRCYRENPFLAHRQAKTQLQWLENALSKSQAKYKVVMGHYPMYSSGLHGAKGDSTLKLRRILEPVLAKYGVDVYLAGHEHHYEKSKPIQGVRHFVSGAGGQVRREVHYRDNPPYPREALAARLHFMVFEETPRGLRYEAIAKTGEVLDTGLIPPKRAAFSRLA